jgi:SagB-type dehydrogenase family enzyme
MKVTTIMASPYYMNEIINHSIELGSLSKKKLIRKGKSFYDNKLLNNFFILNSRRRSQRAYNKASITFKNLSYLLQASYFVNETKEEANDNFRKKNIASPGGLYPIEIYYLNLRGKYLQKGAYYYDENDSSLNLISNTSEDDFLENVYKAFGVEHKEDIDIKSASGIIVLGSSFNRMTFKYLDRGIRWAFTEAGAILNNLQLVSTTLNISSCPCAGFYDDIVSEIIGYKSTDQAPIIS